MVYVYLHETYRPRAYNENRKREETGVYAHAKRKEKNDWAKRVVGSEKCNNKMRAAQKEALAIVRKTYGSIPGHVLQ